MNDTVTENPLRSRYAEWKRRFDDRTTADTEEDFTYSTSWDHTWADIWAQYDELEDIRTRGNFPKETWQDVVDEFSFMRKHISKSPRLSAHDWAQMPLGMVLDKKLGTTRLSGRSDAAVALKRWRKFGEVVAGQPGFLGALSTPQRRSWTILRHWWSATYQEPGLSNAAIESLEAAATSAVPMKSFHWEIYPDEKAYTDIRRSVYHSTMFNLFNREFSPYHWPPHYRHFKEIQLTTLRISRLEGIKHATAQRLAYTSYMKSRGQDTSDAGFYIASLDKPCPWLRKETDDRQLPYFLWDVEQKRTITVNNIESAPEYCCVSHTWGRWRKEDIVIDGVPWLVPQNEKFDVERLPEHLQHIQPPVRFVWIDLFCIPQDGSPKADEEIARQALIFQNACRCIAWMNDVRQWEATMSALDWLSVSYLHATTTPGIYDLGTLLQLLGHEAKCTSEIFSIPHDRSEMEKLYYHDLLMAIDDQTLAQPANWFSSLWTLQEVMLCPDVTLVSRDWIPLSDRSGTPIPMDAFLRLIDMAETFWHRGLPYDTFTEGPINVYYKTRISMAGDYLGWPDGPRQLHALCCVTRMDTLLDSPSPIGLLIAANLRQCTGSRAPAIMSALGITDWYESHSETDKALVLNSYPLAFVKEAASKLGASFYGSVSRGQRVLNDYGLFNRSDKGSMMPFSAKSGWRSRMIDMIAERSFAPYDHPAVKTWNIRKDASVDVKQVGIVASTDTANAGDQSIVINIMRSKTNHAFGGLFADYMQDLPKGMCMYAISLLHDSGRHHGIILQGYPRRWFSTQRLVKVGLFVVAGTEIPPTTDVEWVVW